MSGVTAKALIEQLVSCSHGDPNKKRVSAGKWVTVNVPSQLWYLLNSFAKQALPAVRSHCAPTATVEPSTLIPWIGDKSHYISPVSDDTYVDINFRNGEVCCNCRAGNYSWRDTGSEDDIIAYRVHITSMPVDSGKNDELLKLLNALLAEPDRTLLQRPELRCRLEKLIGFDSTDRSNT